MTIDTTLPTAADIKRELDTLADPEKATFLLRFFRTGPGEYGEGDVFIGLTVPQSRRVARQFVKAPLIEAFTLLKSDVHEHRLVALLLLVQRYQKSKDEKERDRIFYGYLKHTKYINNWDLVDLSAPNIIGAHLIGCDTGILDRLTKSKLLWDRRIAVLATHAFIRQNQFGPTLRICEALLNDKHDLIHKATGWMLREVGKRDEKPLLAFLDRHAGRMPRTMLRYSIERLQPTVRARYMGMKAY